MFTKFVTSMDKQISNTLKAAKITLRPVKSHGLWCHLLLPIILTMYNIKYKCSTIYSLTAYISVGLMIYSTLFFIFISLTTIILKENIFSGTTASSFVSTVLLYYYLDYGLISSLTITFSTISIYSVLLRHSLSYSKTFTIGEAMIVVQGIVLFAFMSIAKLILEDIDIDHNFQNVILYAFLLSVGLMIIMLYSLSEDQRNMKILFYTLFLGGTFCLLILHALMGTDCIEKILNFIFSDILRIRIFSCWGFMLAFSVILVYLTTIYGNKASTATRKSFHILGGLVFTSGILLDLEFMRFAAGLAFGLIILIEALRKSKIEPVSSSLQSAFFVYCDEKDVGCFAMSPIYLFMGLACPLLLVPDHEHNKLELLSGVLAVGIGDTAASWFGSRYGTIKWKDSNRTVEGTCFNVITQICSVYTLQYYDLLNEPYMMVRGTAAALMSGVIEAKLDQVDNLVLPLVTIISLQLTSFL